MYLHVKKNKLKVMMIACIMIEKNSIGLHYRGHYSGEIIYVFLQICRRRMWPREYFIDKENDISSQDVDTVKHKKL